jgi:hypothetical protein
MKKSLLAWIPLALGIGFFAFAMDWGAIPNTNLGFLHLPWFPLLSLLALAASIRVWKLNLPALPMEGLALLILAVACSAPCLPAESEETRALVKASAFLGVLSLGCLAFLSVELWAKFRSLPAPLLALFGLIPAYLALWAGFGQDSLPMILLPLGILGIASMARHRMGLEIRQLRGMGFLLLGLRLIASGPNGTKVGMVLNAILVAQLLLWAFAHVAWERARQSRAWMLGAAAFFVIPPMFLKAPSQGRWLVESAGIALAWWLCGIPRQRWNAFLPAAPSAELRRRLQVWRIATAGLIILGLVEALDGHSLLAHGLAQEPGFWFIPLALIGAGLRKWALKLPARVTDGLGLAL